MKIVIPARYASTRLPGKPLLEIENVPLVVWVMRKAASVVDVGDVFVATDDARIAKVVELYDGQAVMTHDRHESGTDRILEVADKMAWTDDTNIINVQGDEPFIPPALIQLVADLMKKGADMATAATPINNMQDVTNPNVVKVVTAGSGQANYFSRSPIPHVRDGEAPAGTYLRHIGIYGYKADTLRKLGVLPVAPAEKLESLEQLRALHNGIPIQVGIVNDAPPHGIDTPEDLEAARKFAAQASL